jgi:hypothetical protein
MKRNIYFYAWLSTCLLLLAAVLKYVIIPVTDRILDGMMPYIP